MRTAGVEIITAGREHLPATRALAGRRGVRAWLLLRIAPNRRRARHPAERTIGDLAAGPWESVWIVHPGDRAVFAEAAGRLIHQMSSAETFFCPVVHYAIPPRLGIRDDGPVRSYGCTPDVCRDLAVPLRAKALAEACFQCLIRIVRGSVRVERLIVRQVPQPAAPVWRPRARDDTALLIPHRGPSAMLSTCLHYVHGMDGRAAGVRVGLDTTAPRALLPVARDYPSTNFFTVHPAPAGPYVLRDALARRARETLLAWQDSDDLPCADRLVRLRADLARTHCDFIGSHELRVDEINGTVKAIRYPLDVTGALERWPGQSLLGGAALIRRAAYLQAGGFSRHRMFNSDTEFLLRAYFHMRIRNVDEFLYVRWRRTGSLTTRLASSGTSPARMKLDRRIKEDFKRVLDGSLPLDASALAPHPGTKRHRLRPLR